MYRDHQHVTSSVVNKVKIRSKDGGSRSTIHPIYCLQKRGSLKAFNYLGDSLQVIERFDYFHKFYTLLKLILVEKLSALGFEALYAHFYPTCIIALRVDSPASIDC